MPHWFNIARKVRVQVTNDQLSFINKHKRTKKLPRSSLSLEESIIADDLVKKSIFGRYKTDTETFYLFNR
jgi:hypothetical protein